MAIKDERINALTHRIGYEAFMLVMAYCGVAILVKQFFLDMKPGVESIVLILGCMYYSIRTAFSGAAIMPSNPEEIRRLSKWTIIGMGSVSLAFGIILSIRNCIKYQGGHYDVASLSVVIITFVGMFSLMLFSTVIYMAISVRVEKKMDE